MTRPNRESASLDEVSSAESIRSTEAADDADTTSARGVSAALGTAGWSPTSSVSAGAGTTATLCGSTESRSRLFGAARAPSAVARTGGTFEIEIAVSFAPVSAVGVGGDGVSTGGVDGDGVPVAGVGAAGVPPGAGAEETGRSDGSPGTGAAVTSMVVDEAVTVTAAFVEIVAAGAAATATPTPAEAPTPGTGVSTFGGCAAASMAALAEASVGSAPVEAETSVVTPIFAVVAAAGGSADCGAGACTAASAAPPAVARTSPALVSLLDASAAVAAASDALPVATAALASTEAPAARGVEAAGATETVAAAVSGAAVGALIGPIPSAAPATPGSTSEAAAENAASPLRYRDLVVIATCCGPYPSERSPKR